ncbi:MAG: heat-inducible transcriptional repressor HrcA [Lachnospiraceae bacterium]|nr:heat-inducible transcriptional repressor HrcA [Lachnospiraceae bacterium]
MEELDERKVKILNAIIQNYMETGEPVGSRTISKSSDLNLSSATIRNEMSDLEELGYIVQPHTSAGRIPSDKGYRFYVDHLIAEKDEEISDIKDLMIEKTEKMEKMLKQVVKVLANNTQYATMISAPALSGTKVKFVQLSQVNENQILSVVMMSGNIVKNKLIDVDEPLNSENMLKLNMLLNTNLNGLTVSDINLALISRMKAQAGEFEGIIEQVLQTVAETIGDEEMEIYTSGATNIFKYPELADSQKASEFISAFEEKEELRNLISDIETDGEKTGTGIQVYIGDESPIQTMKDCSVVTATYELGEGVKGTIGIIGPKRMDYKNVMDNLTHLKNQLDQMLKKADET